MARLSSHTPHAGHTPPETIPWALSAEAAMDALKTSPQGLTELEVIARRKRYGENTLPKPFQLDVLTILIRQFASPLVFILIGAAVLTAFLHEWLETIVILLAVLINAGLGFYQEYSAEHVLEKLMTYIKERARVVRGGAIQETDSTLLVPGDIVHIQVGARIPADARLISENALSVDESILTGESLPIKKEVAILSEGTPLAERTNMVFAGTSVVDGNAIAVVSATDSHTEIGRIAELVTKTGYEPTPLQRALSQLAWFIFVIVGFIVVAIFILGVSRGETWLDMLLIAIAVSVGAIPEALPIALTVILAIGLQRLAAKKGIMRSLSAAETLGSATIVMTDKTGTLTQAKLHLTNILPLQRLASGETSHADVSNEERLILDAALAGVDVVVENPKDSPEKWRASGHPIETGILHAAIKHDIDVVSHIHGHRAPLLTFNSTNKFSIAAHHRKNTYIAIGAPDILLKRSKLTKKAYLGAEQAIHAISSEGKRLVGVARFKKTSLSRFSGGTAKESDAENLEFLGVLVFEDPLRPEARGAIEKIESLGASVVMVTGDLKGTAMSIGRRLGWDITEGNVLSGDELRQLSDEELLANLKNIRVFARVTPEDKLRIGKLYQRLGEVVAMTGDGVNDAPSLKAADIGIAIGSGNDVAKATADLVLLDDNFKTIVSAIEEGRRMLDNIRKTAVYLLSTSLNEVMLIGGALLVGLPLPLSALQIIWINLFTEGFPALAFAFDQNYDSKRGLKASGGIFNTQVRILTIGLGTIISGLLFGLYYALLHYGVALDDARSTVFLCLATYILFVAFSLRSLRQPIYSYNPFDNAVLNTSVLFATLVIILTVTLPPLQNIFDVHVPPLPLLGIVFLWLIANIIVIECTKFFFRTFFPE